MYVKASNTRVYNEIDDEIHLRERERRETRDDPNLQQSKTIEEQERIERASRISIHTFSK